MEFVKECALEKKNEYEDEHEKLSTFCKSVPNPNNYPICFFNRPNKTCQNKLIKRYESSMKMKEPFSFLGKKKSSKGKIGLNFLSVERSVSS